MAIKITADALGSQCVSATHTLNISGLSQLLCRRKRRVPERRKDFKTGCTAPQLFGPCAGHP